MPYSVVTVRVPRRLAIQCEDLARTLGWQLADYLRTVISIGAIFFILSTASPEGQKAASKLLGGLELLKLSRSFSLHPARRPYAFRIQGRKSTLVTLSLPQSLRNLVETYAGLLKASRNQAYYKCLHQGLLIYLKAQTSILTPRTDGPVTS